MFQALGFDLDNTLYDQSQHLCSFFGEAGRWLNERTDVAAETAEQCFERTWERRTMSDPFLFDAALQELGVWRADWVKELVQLYRRHRCPLTLAPGVRSLLDHLRPRYELFLVTDGHGPLQRFKVEQLGLSEWFPVVIYTDDRGPSWCKPAPAAFLEAARRLGLAAEACLYVGDDPERDVQGARRAGMATARVLQGPYRNRPCLPPPDFVLDQLRELKAVMNLARWPLAASASQEQPHE
jgi:putative hydrolase of the HAD superfamily